MKGLAWERPRPGISKANVQQLCQFLAIVSHKNGVTAPSYRSSNFSLSKSILAKMNSRVAWERPRPTRTALVISRCQNGSSSSSLISSLELSDTKVHGV